jgi:hypothetical protein
MKIIASQTCERPARRKPAAMAQFLLAIVLLVTAMKTVPGADCRDDSLKRINRGTLVTASSRGGWSRILPTSTRASKV